MTNTIELAHNILKVALSSGFRESGIMNASTPPTLAIRTNGLAFDCIIGHYNTRTQNLCQMVDEGYISMLSTIANTRFKENERRRELFSRAMYSLLNTGSKWEAKEMRKQRMRKEGLMKRSELRENMLKSNDNPGTEVEEEEEASSLCLDQFMTF